MALERPGQVRAPAGLVYIAALAPDADETVAEPAEEIPRNGRLLPYRGRGRTYLDAP